MYFAYVHLWNIGTHAFEQTSYNQTITYAGCYGFSVHNMFNITLQFSPSESSTMTGGLYSEQKMKAYIINILITLYACTYIHIYVHWTFKAMKKVFIATYIAQVTCTCLCRRMKSIRNVKLMRDPLPCILRSIGNRAWCPGWWPRPGLGPQFQFRTLTKSKIFQGLVSG